MDFRTDPKKQAIEVCFPHKVVSDNPKLLSPTNFRFSENHEQLYLILDTN